VSRLAEPAFRDELARARVGVKAHRARLSRLPHANRGGGGGGGTRWTRCPHAPAQERSGATRQRAVARWVYVAGGGLRAGLASTSRPNPSLAKQKTSEHDRGCQRTGTSACERLAIGSGLRPQAWNALPSPREWSLKGSDIVFVSIAAARAR